MTPRRGARAPLILISGGFGNANSGDEALLACEEAELRERFPEARIVAFSDDVEVSRRIFPPIGFCYSGRFGLREPGKRGLDAYRWLPRMLSLLRRADILLTGGGTILQDATHRFFVPFWFVKVGLAQLFGTPTMFYGVGAGPIERPSSIRLLRLFGRHVRRYTLRGPLSERWLLRAGVPAGLLEVTADPAVRLTPAPADRVGAILAEEGVAADNRPLVGVCVREWWKAHGRSLSEKEWVEGKREAYSSLMDAFAGVCERAVREHGARLLFVPMSMKAPNDDRDAADAVAERLRDRGIAPEEYAIVRGDLTPHEAKGLLGRCEAVIAMRFHPLVYATMQGVPVLGVAYGLKTFDYLEYLGLEEFAVPVEEADGERLVSMFDALWSRRASLSEETARRAEAARERAARNVEVVAEVLEGGQRR